VEAQLGFAHFLAHADGVGKFLLALLAAMSVTTWYVIVIKAWASVTLRNRTRRFLETFWNSPSLDAVASQLGEHHPDEPFSISRGRESWRRDIISVTQRASSTSRAAAPSS
jgi:biopolymer transport protein ExbB